MPRPVILCVDDERTVLTSLKEQLRRRFGREYVVELAESGEDALEVIEELVEGGDDLAVVISDQIMPGMKGDDLLAIVHERHPEVRKIMLTGQASSEAIGNAVNRAGLYRYLAKPWDAADLELTVRSALDSLLGDRAREEQREMLREMADVSVALTANLAGDDRYRRLVESARRVLWSDRAVVFRLTDGVLVPLASSVPDLAPVSLTDAPALAADLGAMAPVRRDAAEARAVGSTEIGWPARDRSLITVPLSVAQTPVGVLVVGSDRVDPHRQLRDDRVLAFAALAAASIRTTELVDALEAASEHRREVAEELQREAAQRDAGALIGKSAAVRQLLHEIDIHAPSRAPALIVGLPGAGVETVARALHDAGASRTGPFIAVEAMLVCDAFDLLGPTPDPHAGPTSERNRSKLGLAAGGTLFIAGVDLLPRAAQEALAERLAAGAGARVMGSVTQDPTGGLVPALGSAFGEHRLYVPPLRERVADLPALSEHFLRLHARRVGRDVQRLSEESLERMKVYAWPGNVRELSHVIERAVVTAKGVVADIGEFVGTGFSIGSYQLTDRLGSGGMGEVWRARHLHLARPAAVKLIRSDRGHDAAAVERFRREAAATAELRSPHTVELYDFGVTENGELYFVMELLDGLDLHTLVAHYGPVPAGRAIHLARQVCLSLGEAHAVGLVHRDIKPANLFVCELGLEVDFLKVLDFGLVSSQGNDSLLTQDGQIAGTPAFMAPESVVDTDVDGRADIYALGCVVHWLLTGEFVFAGNNFMNVAFKHREEAPPTTSTLAEHPVPAELDALVQRCLAKIPEGRPESAMELYDALGAIEVEPWSQADARAWWTRYRARELRSREVPTAQELMKTTTPAKPREAS